MLHRFVRFHARAATRLLSGALLLPLLLIGCQTIQYDRATNNDTTPPAVGLRLTGTAPGDLAQRPVPAAVANSLTPVETTALTLGTPPTAVRVHEDGTADIVATAQDNESGIELLKLTCQRTVYSRWDAASRTESNALLLPETQEVRNQISYGQVPSSAILQRLLNMRQMMRFTNAAGTTTIGHAVSATCSAEAKNFNGQTVYAHAIVVFARDRLITGQ